MKDNPCQVRFQFGSAEKIKFEKSYFNDNKNRQTEEGHQMMTKAHFAYGYINKLITLTILIGFFAM